MSGWRPALRIARRSMRRHLGRSVLIALLIAVPIAGAATMDGLLRTISGPEHAAYQNMGDADGVAEVTGTRSVPDWQPGAPAEGEGERDPASVDLGTLLPAGSRFVPDGEMDLLWLADGDHLVRADLDALALGDPLTNHEARLVRGRLPTGPDEVLVTEPLAERLGILDGDGGEVRSGATVTTRDGASASVTGIGVDPQSTDRSAVLGPHDTVLMPRRDAEQQGITRYLVDLPEGADPDTVWPALAKQGVTFTPRAAYSHPDRYPMMYPDDPIETLGPVALVVGFGLLEVVLLAGAAFAVGARRQVRELGLIAANGGTGKHVGRTVLAQGLTLGVLGAGGGLLFGAGLLYAAWPLWEDLAGEYVPSWRFGWVELVVAGLVGLLSGLAAALLPAIGAARMRPVDALAQRFRATTRGARLPVLGLVLLAVGAAGVVGSALLAREEVASAQAESESAAYVRPDLALPAIGVMAAAVVVIAGLIMITSGMVSLLGRGAGALPLSGRLALRDAGRHRHRTVPAVAAIMVVVAGSVTLAFMVAADAEGQVRTQPENTLTVRSADVLESGDPEGVEAGRTALVDGAREMAATLPGGSTVDVPTLRQVDGQVVLYAGESYDCVAGSVGIADPGVLAMALGHRPDASLLADLDRGSVVTLDDCVVRDGTVHTEAAESGEKAVELPARYEPRPEQTYFADLPTAFVSAATAKAHGWTAAVETVAVRHSPEATQDDIDAALVVAEDNGLDAWNPNESQDEKSLITLVLAGGAGLVTLLGVAVTVALSSAESRADLATLAAIGAQPRRRRTLAGAQAFVIAAVGTGLGVLLGVVLGFAASPLSGTLAFAMPWTHLAITVLGVPLLAVVVAMAVTRSRLPMVRRLD